MSRPIPDAQDLHVGMKFLFNNSKETDRVLTITNLKIFDVEYKISGDVTSRTFETWNKWKTKGSLSWHEDNKVETVAASSTECSCQLDMLMCRGCMCGAMEAERESS